MVQYKLYHANSINRVGYNQRIYRDNAHSRQMDFATAKRVYLKTIQILSAVNRTDVRGCVVVGGSASANADYGVYTHLLPNGVVINLRKH